MYHAYKNLLAAFGFCLFAIGGQAASFSNFGLNFNYSSGNPGYYTPALGQPIVGYGATGSAYGVMSGICYGGGGYYGGNGGVWGPGNPANPGLPATLPPVMPPVMPPYPQMPGGVWGPGSMYPFPGGGMSHCGLPCGAGMRPAPIYAVPGGPVVQNSGVIMDSGYSHRSGAQVYSVNGQTIIDLSANRSINEWEKNDNGEIVGAMAAGVASTMLNVYPVGFPRNAPTYIPILGNGQPATPGQHVRPNYGYGH